MAYRNENEKFYRVVSGVATWLVPRGGDFLAPGGRGLAVVAIRYRVIFINDNGKHSSQLIQTETYNISTAWLIVPETYLVIHIKYQKNDYIYY